MPGDLDTWLLEQIAEDERLARLAYVARSGYREEWRP